MDEAGQEVPSAEAEIHCSLTVGKYCQCCSFMLEQWNGKAVKVLTKLGDTESALIVFGKIESGGLKLTCSIKSLKYEAESRFGKDALMVKAWKSGLPVQKSMCECSPLLPTSFFLVFKH